MTELTTHTLAVPGAVLAYDLRPGEASAKPALVLIGSPMGASGFGTLAGHFTDRTVVTYDPRGVERSVRTDDAIQSTPEEHADDLHRLIGYRGRRAARPLLAKISTGPASSVETAAVNHTGPIPDDYSDRPAPDPAMFGLSTEDDGSRDDALVGQNIVSCTHFQPDFDALRAASTRIVLAKGVESDGQMACRAAEAVAERLGTAPVTFPSGHGGFLGD